MKNYFRLVPGDVVTDRGCRLKITSKKTEENGPEHVIDTFHFQILCPVGGDNDHHWHGLDREIHRQINDHPSPWDWTPYWEPRMRYREWWVRYLDYVDNDHHVTQLGPHEYHVSLGQGRTVTCRSQTEIEAALSKYRGEDG